MAERLANRPAGTVGQAFPTDAERLGAYRLLEQDQVSHEAIALAIRESCAIRSGMEELVLVAIDGSSLTFTDRQRSKGLGPIGRRSGGAQGLKTMLGLAMTLDGIPLGVPAIEMWTRPKKRRTKHRNRRKTEEKETQRWLEAMAQTTTVFQQHAPQTLLWFQMDREADSWPILSYPLNQHLLTVRASYNRTVKLAQGKDGKLFDLLNAAEVKGTTEVLVREKRYYSKGKPRKRQERLAKLAIRFEQVTLDLVDQSSRQHTDKTLFAVMVQEISPIPEGEEPLRWVLLTTYPVESVEDAILVVHSYTCRWRIEELHRTWKTGSCNVERSQLRSKQPLLKWATIHLAVAARIERLKYLARSSPKIPATVELSEVEIRAAAIVRFGKGHRRACRKGYIPSIEKVVLWIAESGGYSKHSGGPPGSTTIARGWERVEAAVQVLETLGLEET
jgi:hypothetical protein